MPVHRRVTPSSKFAGTHLYTWVERGTMGVKCLAQEHNAVPRPGLDPGPFDPESSALTIRPPRLPYLGYELFTDGVFLSHGLYHNMKTEQKSNQTSKCSNQSKNRKQNCIHGVSADSCRFYLQCSCSCFLYRGDRNISAYFSSEFCFPMARNLPPDKLSRESCALFL